MKFEKIDITKENINPFQRIGQDWMLISAEREGKVNTMTASWGMMGVFWGKNVVTVGIRPQRFTKEFVDEVSVHFEKGDILLLQNEINELDYIIGKASHKEMQIILNPSPYNENLKTCDLNKVAMFLVNEIEGGQITGEKEPHKILEKFKEMYPKASVVLTLGGDGSMYQDKTGIYKQDIFKVKAVDTTAAGDTFTGYFIASVLEGMKPAEGLKMASKASSIAVSRPGAAASIPLREEL